MANFREDLLKFASEGNKKLVLYFLDQIFQADADGYLFGAELKWNLFEGNKRFGKAKKSRAQLEKSKLELAKYKNESRFRQKVFIR